MVFLYMIYTKSDASFEQTEFDLSMRDVALTASSCTLIVAGSDNSPTRLPTSPFKTHAWKDLITQLARPLRNGGAGCRSYWISAQERGLCPVTCPIPSFCAVLRDRRWWVVEGGLAKVLVRSDKTTATPLQGGARWWLGVLAGFRAFGLH